MKKLTYLTSAVAAAFAGNAYADVSVSGSGTVGYADTTGDGHIITGSSVTLVFQQLLLTVVTISTGLSITGTVSAENGASTSGGQS